MGFENDLAEALRKSASAYEIHVIHGKKECGVAELHTIGVLIGIIGNNLISPKTINSLESVLRLPLLERFHGKIRRILDHVPAREKEVALSVKG